MVETPILFITFARPEYARRVFDAIKTSKPKVLYFYSNHARDNRPDEVRRNADIRKMVDEIDWECDLHTWFRDEYVDIYTSLRKAMDWIFDNEEMAIILEEDVVPTPAFFSFCDQMLEKFKNEMRVWYVSGCNFLNNNPQGYDYIFTHNHWVWGWATWRSRWTQLLWKDIPFEELISGNYYNGLYKSKRQVAFRKKELKRVKDFVPRTGCWDFDLGITADVKGAVGVVPREQLSTCIGMQGENSSVATKTVLTTKANPQYETYVISKEPETIEADKEYDYAFFVKYERYMRLYNRVLRRGVGTLVKYWKKLRVIRNCFEL